MNRLWNIKKNTIETRSDVEIMINSEILHEMGAGFHFIRFIDYRFERKIRNIG